MSDPMHEPIHRKVQESVGEGDAKRRRVAIKALYTDDVVVYGPPGPITAHDDIDKFAGELCATHPTFGYTPIGEPQSAHNAVRLRWGSGPRGEALRYTGEDVAVISPVASAISIDGRMGGWHA
jgi:hypothetical protein